MTLPTHFCHNARAFALVLAGGLAALSGGCGDDDPAPLVAVVGASPDLLVADDDARDALGVTDDP